MDNNKLGNKIREARGDLSLRDFAKKCGISHTHLDSIEKGYDPRTGKPVKVSLDTIKKLSAGTGIPLHNLIDYDLNELIEISEKPASSRTDIEAYAHDYMQDQLSDLGISLTETLRKEKSYEQNQAAKNACSAIHTFLESIRQLPERERSTIIKELYYFCSEYLKMKGE